jgi:DNA helicase-2/ATP-dependent DNA helicase PcrA
VSADLDPEQQQVAIAPRGPLCVIAGAGTGKTRALTHRIAALSESGQITPAHTLALTFTARAAGQLRSRLRHMGVDGVSARTFHSAALRQLRYFWPAVVGGDAPDIVAAKAPLVVEAAHRQRVRPERAIVRDLAAEIEWAKVSEVTPEMYPSAAAAASRTPPSELTFGAVGAIYQSYEQVKRDRQVIDFEDVLLLTAGMIADDRAMAESVRQQYRHFFVDEYQDVSPAQQRLLEAWLGDRDDLTVVGDPSQTIYSFAGATPSFLLTFTSRWPGAAKVELTRNYRSTAPIVHLANRLLAEAHGAAATQRVTLRAEAPEGSSGPAAAPLFLEYADEPTEAAAVASTIATLVGEGTAPRDIAVLFRTNAQSRVYEDALTALGVAYFVRGGERFFERSEVREGITLIRGAARAGEVSGDLSSHVAAILATAGYRPEAPVGPGAARDRWESLSALVTLSADIAAESADNTLTHVVDELERRASLQHAPEMEGVTLASLHSAKGLEWEVVFLVGLTDGTLPISYAQTQAHIEEERRLLYVGATRAKHRLQLSWSLARSPGGRANRRPSRFITPLLPEAPGTGSRGSGKAPRRRSVACVSCGRALTTAVERKLRHCSHCEVVVDLELFEQLRAWRKRTSDQDSVPAYVVFTDATLTAIAQDKPRNERELAAIPGIGRAKLDRYGGDVLALVADS